MQRRDFIRLIGGAVAVWPISARSQETGRAKRIGFLRVGPPRQRIVMPSFCLQTVNVLGQRKNASTHEGFVIMVRTTGNGAGA